MVYALLLDKSKKTYCELFSAIKSVAVDHDLVLSLAGVTMDLQSGTLPALKLEFPSTDVRGCFFHFCSNVYKFLQRKGYVTLYRQNTSVRTFYRQAMAIPFLPAPQIEAFFVEFIDTYSVDGFPGMEVENVTNMLSEFQVYFQSTWFPLVNEISVHGREIRTNNFVEGWHSGLAKSLKANPNVFDFIKHLKKEQACTEATRREIELASQERPKKRRKYRELDDRIKAITAQFDRQAITAKTYVERIAHFIHHF